MPSQDGRAAQQRCWGLGAGGVAPQFLVGLARRLWPRPLEPRFLGSWQSLGSRRFREVGRANQFSMAKASRQQEGGPEQEALVLGAGRWADWNEISSTG